MNILSDSQNITGFYPTSAHRIGPHTRPGEHRVFAVWTRDHATKEMAGRDKFVSATKSALSEYSSCHFIVRNRLQIFGPFGLARILSSYVRGLINHTPKALQVLLYQSNAELERFRAALIEYQPDTILIDTVRLVPFAIEARRLMPDAKIIVDMDDLMSRRYDELSRLSVDLNLGVINKLVPRAVSGLVSRIGLTQSIYRIEAKALRSAESDITGHIDCAIFASQREAELYRESLPAAGAPQVEYICPPVFEVRDRFGPVALPLRFIWVGTDGLTQNEESIKYLLDLWNTKKISTPLVLFGKMTKAWPATPNVTFAGFEPDMHRVYSAGSILVVPSFVKGGIKTKVLEAFGLDTPVIGTREAFEGLELNYPLSFSDIGQMEKYILSIDGHVDELRRAQTIGHDFVRRNCALDAFSRKWEEVIGDALEMKRPRIASAI